MEKLKKILSKVLKIDENSITEKTSPDTVDTWDSFNSLMLVSELENEFGVKFTIDEVVKIKNVGDIIEVLRKYKINI
ncbi:MAG TPA: acyl carrier protein [Candidatus Paceibacterota bacterium]